MDELGLILSIDNNAAKIIDDAYSIDFDEEGNYILDIYISDPISQSELMVMNIINANINSEAFNQTGKLKKAFLNFSLSEREEKPVFDFRFKISKDGDILSFDTLKKYVMIDIEMTHDDVVDSINEDSYISDYLAIAYELGELIAEKNQEKVDFDDSFEKIKFPFPFPKEFLKLLNITLLEKCLEFDLPIIFFAVPRNRKKNTGYTPSYSTSEIPDDSDVYARFNSPLRRIDCLYNLLVFNVFIYNNQYNNEELLENYRSLIDGYVKLGKSFANVGRIK